MRDLRGVLDAVLAGVVVFDADGTVEFLNAAACRILETSTDACDGVPVERLLGADHAVARLVRGVLETGRSAAETERRIERRFQEALTVDASASPLSADASAGAGVVLLLRDRTIQKSLEDLVSQRESLSAFGQIAAGLAHEVKNPLGGIRGAAELIASRTDDLKSRETAALIVREVGRIASLVDDLMVFARNDQLDLGRVNIHRVLDDVLELLAMDPLSARVSVRRGFDPSIPELEADGDRLTQVFLNLAQNAIQAMGNDGGELSIATRMSLDHRLSSPKGEHVPTVLVDLADTGPGVAPELLGQIATPFFTTRDGGTGLGLAVARHWVTRHGGALHIDSTPGSGMRVRVALPLRLAS